MQEPLLRIGALASRAGVSNRTVDFYTRLGLLSPAARTRGNFRLYREGDVRRIAIIRHLEAQGIRLEDIAGILSALSRCDDKGVEPSACPAIEDVLARYLVTIDAHVQALREVAQDSDVQARGVVTTLVARAQSLMATALLLSEEILPGIHVLPPH